MNDEIRVKVSEEDQRKIFIRFIKKFKRDFSSSSNHLRIKNSDLSKYKRAITRYIPEDVLNKVVNYLKIESPKILEKGTLKEIRLKYMYQAHPKLREKYGDNWAKELTKRRDFKGINLEDFPNETYIYLTNEFKNRFFEYACNLTGSQNKLAKKINVPVSTLINWKKGWQKDTKRNKIGLQFIPLNKLKLISRILIEDNNQEFSMLNVQKHTLMYRMKAGNPIKNPKFPIKESPELTRLLFHLLGDGYGGGKGNSAGYKNIRNELLKEFKEDLKIFGDVPIYEQQYSIKFPRLIANIIVNFYNVNPRTFDSIISDKIIKLPKKYLYHGIRAFADDEGCMDGGVILCSANKNLLEGIGKLLDYIKLRHNNIRTCSSEKATYGGVYTITILDLKKYYKLIGFTHQIKKEKLEKYIKKKKFKSRRRELKLKS